MKNAIPHIPAQEEIDAELDGSGNVEEILRWMLRTRSLTM
jgi:hypothetical protein